MTKTIATIALFLGAFLGFIGLSGCGFAKSDDMPACMAGENEICPSEAWTKTFKKATEMEQTLNRGIPGGYRYDNQSGKFLKIPAPPPPAPSPMVAPPKK